MKTASFQYSPFSPYRYFLASVALGTASIFVPKQYQLVIVRETASATVNAAVKVLTQSLLDLSIGQVSVSITPLHVIGFVVLAGGRLLQLKGVSEFKKHGTETNSLGKGKVSALVTTGVYRFTRNPIYLGAVIFQTGLSIFANSWLPLLIITPWVLAVNFIVTPGEERGLRDLYGDEYVDYKKKTPKWILF